MVELPFGKGKKYATEGVADAIAGGWTIAFITTWQAGFPLNVQQSNPNSVPGRQQRAAEHHVRRRSRDRRQLRGSARVGGSSGGDLDQPGGVL